MQDETIQDEAVFEDQAVEAETDTAEVHAAEDSAMNTDNETATAMEMEGEEVEADRKHKNRESTSEKAKRAAAEREATKDTPAALAKVLDPLRLRGKKYRAVVALVDRTKRYTPEEALALVKELSTASFDAAVELHIVTKGEAVRGTVVLPNGNGKTRKVVAATDEVLEELAAGTFNFDVLLATPAQMPKLAKFAKILGPKGLMPSPKAGTVTDNIEATMAEINSGRVEYRADKTGVIHLSIGKVSFSTEKLLENYNVLMQALVTAKVMSIVAAPTMGPSVRVVVAK